MILLFFLVLLSGISPPSFAKNAAKPYDYVIKGALVYDGESLVPIKRDIALAGDRIVQLGNIPEEEANEVIEGEGLIAAPGFIDIHTHSDFNPFVYPNLGNKVLQGVTTEVVGNCGMSAAPVQGAHREEMPNVWRREGVVVPSDISWSDFKEYRNETEYQGMETNFVGLVGHGNLRSSVMGMVPRDAGKEELESMRRLLARALDQGAFGVSFGLTYLPGVFATHKELVTLCREAAQRGGLCAFHIRGEGDPLIQAVEEAIAVGREAGAATHISHLKAQGKTNWPKIDEAIRLIEAAQAEGIKVTADAYPYTASFAELGAILPKEIYEDPHRLGRITDPNQREKLLADLEKYYGARPVDWNGIRVATVAGQQNFSLQGKSIQEISSLLHKPPLQVLIDLLGVEAFKVSAFYFSQSPQVVEKVLGKPYVAIGSDSIADGSAAPHPRAYGTFVNRLAICSSGGPIAANPCWGKTIYQMTALPAKILGLRQRGRIGTGSYADLVLFDPSAVKDRADYAHPKIPPSGIRWVFVNGESVVREKKYQPAHSGLFLTRRS